MPFVVKQYHEIEKCDSHHTDRTCGCVCFCFSDLVAQRGEKLELLIDKTENLVDSVSLKAQPGIGEQFHRWRHFHLTFGLVFIDWFDDFFHALIDLFKF